MTLYHKLDIILIHNQHIGEDKTLIKYFDEIQTITFTPRLCTLAWNLY